MIVCILGSMVMVAAILLAIEVGRRIGMRRFKEEGEDFKKGFSAVESAVFALMGLVLAFSFSGALSRFDARRHLVVEEVNDVGTAWLRIDLLPAEVQPKMRELFRRYLDFRIGLYQDPVKFEAAEAELGKQTALQNEIWTLAVAASRDMPASTPGMLLLPALNAMFDITTTRTEAIRIHTPAAVFAMLGALTLACSLFAGYDMAGGTRLKRLHAVFFAVVLSVTIYVIVDLEYPRLGLITMSDSDHVMPDLRKSMN
ncbi:MAG TPA: hypothetical protein VGH65_06310 [Verrucomicrobiaceae bacterium]